MLRALFALPLLACCLHHSQAEYTWYPEKGFYKYYDTPLNWSAAQQVCAQDGGHLLILNSREEARLLWKDFNRTAGANATFAHLGFHDLFLDNNFTTLYGEPLRDTGYSAWGPTKCPVPAACANTGHCGALSSRAVGLYHRDCASRYSFFCELELWHDYETYPGVGFYKLHRDGKSWGEAWQTCQQEGATLAVLNSDAEYDTLQGMLFRHPTLLLADTDDLVHLGFHNKFNPTVYNTVTGGFLNATGYFHWDPKEPSDRGNCGGLARKGKLRMLNCSATLAFLCEHALN